MHRASFYLWVYLRVCLRSVFIYMYVYVYARVCACVCVCVCVCDYVYLSVCDFWVGGVDVC